VTYDNWKTTNPEDATLGPAPEQWEVCPACCGEGGSDKLIRVYAAGCGFAHDDVAWVVCDVCRGEGGNLVEAEGD
jgi:hypothetical protein